MDFPSLLFAIQVLTHRPLPPGTPLQIRMATTVGSFASMPGDPIAADLIVPVTVKGEDLLPAGSRLTGTLKSVQKVGFGLVHETAALDFDWDQIVLPDGTVLPLAARVNGVDTGRERVTRDGSIRGGRKTSSLAYRFSGYVRTAIAWEIHAPVALWMVKMLLVQLPEPELYYPAGVELTLELTRTLLVPEWAGTDRVDRGFSEQERQRLEEWVDDLPLRAVDPGANRPSDLINLVMIGSHRELIAAFEAAGWTHAEPSSLRAHVRQIRAVSEGHGFLSAPMTTLTVNDAQADMSWQKGFNDLSKRHHIRIWKQTGDWDGNEVWIAAATRDIDFAFMRPGHAMTHKIEPAVDNEREKVVNDIAFTGCSEQQDLFARPDVPNTTQNATGDSIHTDARLAVIKLNACQTPRRTLADFGTIAPRQRGNRWQRLARKEILTFRNDMLRENIYWRSYEGVRWMATSLHAQWRNTHPRNPAITSGELRLAGMQPQHRSRGRIFGDLLR